MAQRPEVRRSRRQRRSQIVAAVEVETQGVVERGLRDFALIRRADALLLQGRAVDPHGKNVRLGRHAGFEHVLSAAQIGLGGAHRLFGDAQALIGEQRPEIGFDDAQQHVRPAGAQLLAGNSAPRPGRFHCVPGAVEVKQSLLDLNERLEIVERVRVVQAPH